MAFPFFSVDPIAQAFWVCTVDVYRKLAADEPTGLGDKWPYSLVVEGAQCSLDAVENFDVPATQFGQMKNQNASDEYVLSVRPNVEIHAMDVVLIHTPYGEAQWWTVKGRTEPRFNIQAQDFLVGPAVEPTIKT